MEQDSPFFWGRGVIRAFFVALILFFWGLKIFQIRFLRFVPSIAELMHNKRKKLAQLCKRSLADALENG